MASTQLIKSEATLTRDDRPTVTQSVKASVGVQAVRAGTATASSAPSDDQSQDDDLRGSDNQAGSSKSSASTKRKALTDVKLLILRALSSAGPDGLTSREVADRVMELEPNASRGSISSSVSRMGLDGTLVGRNLNAKKQYRYFLVSPTAPHLPDPLPDAFESCELVSSNVARFGRPAEGAAPTGRYAYRAESMPSSASGHNSQADVDGAADVVVDVNPETHDDTPAEELSEQASGVDDGSDSVRPDPEAGERLLKAIRLLLEATGGWLRVDRLAQLLRSPLLHSGADKVITPHYTLSRFLKQHRDVFETTAKPQAAVRLRVGPGGDVAVASADGSNREPIEVSEADVPSFPALEPADQEPNGPSDAAQSEASIPKVRKSSKRETASDQPEEAASSAIAVDSGSKEQPKAKKAKHASGAGSLPEEATGPTPEASQDAVASGDDRSDRSEKPPRTEEVATDDGAGVEDKPSKGSAHRKSKRSESLAETEPEQPLDASDGVAELEVEDKPSKGSAHRKSKRSVEEPEPEQPATDGVAEPAVEDKPSKGSAHRKSKRSESLAEPEPEQPSDVTGVAEVSSASAEAASPAAAVTDAEHEHDKLLRQQDATAAEPAPPKRQEKADRSKLSKSQSTKAERRLKNDESLARGRDHALVKERRRLNASLSVSHKSKHIRFDDTVGDSGPPSEDGAAAGDVEDKGKPIRSPETTSSDLSSPASAAPDAADPVTPRLVTIPIFPACPPSNSLFISRLNKLVSASDLKEVFERFGRVANVRTTMHGLIAFVDFTNVDDASNALVALDGKKVCGCKIRVDFSRDQRAAHQQKAKKQKKSETAVAVPTTESPSAAATAQSKRPNSAEVLAAEEPVAKAPHDEAAKPKNVLLSQEPPKSAVKKKLSDQKKAGAKEELPDQKPPKSNSKEELHDQKPPKSAVKKDLFDQTLSKSDEVLKTKKKVTKTEKEVVAEPEPEPAERPKLKTSHADDQRLLIASRIAPCFTCGFRTRDATLLPCGHRPACGVCAGKKRLKCKVCGSLVTSFRLDESADILRPESKPEPETDERPESKTSHADDQRLSAEVPPKCTTCGFRPRGATLLACGHPRPCGFCAGKQRRCKVCGGVIPKHFRLDEYADIVRSLPASNAKRKDLSTPPSPLPEESTSSQRPEKPRKQAKSEPTLFERVSARSPKPKSERDSAKPSPLAEESTSSQRPEKPRKQAKSEPTLFERVSARSPKPKSERDSAKPISESASAPSSRKRKIEDDSQKAVPDHPVTPQRRKKDGEGDPLKPSTLPSDRVSAPSPKRKLEEASAETPGSAAKKPKHETPKPASAKHEKPNKTATPDTIKSTTSTPSPSQRPPSSQGSSQAAFDARGRSRTELSVKGLGAGLVSRDALARLFSHYNGTVTHFEIRNDASGEVRATVKCATPEGAASAVSGLNGYRFSQSLNGLVVAPRLNARVHESAQRATGKKLDRTPKTPESAQRATGSKHTPTTPDSFRPLEAFVGLDLVVRCGDAHYPLHIAHDSYDAFRRCVKLKVPVGDKAVRYRDASGAVWVVQDRHSWEVYRSKSSRVPGGLVLEASGLPDK
eukprot:TRINITY_DN589_c0_g1_i1.p1 TRINITY_DN589_c0_g1~~TRINITY_DN589_c0_g1_i1.p1  ORF type:complete len:1575 (-),score=339.55 TRINITY_DN589_c0_g1_i1:157-4881(-)